MGVWDKISSTLLNPCPKPPIMHSTLDTSRSIDAVYDKGLSKITGKMVGPLEHKIMWKRGKTVFDCLRNAKDQVPANRRAGIYEIPIINKDELLPAILSRKYC